MADDAPTPPLALPIPRRGGAYHRLSDGSLRRDPEARPDPKPRRKAKGEAPAPADPDPVTEA